MNFRLLVLVFSCMLVLSGCRGKLYKYGESFSELMKNDDGLFRGVNIGDTPDQIQQSEGSGPTESSDVLITYNGPIGDYGTYLIRYGFENGRLYEILVDATFDEQTEGQKMLIGFRDYFNDQFGPAQKESGFLVWKTKPGNRNQDVRIEMTDESEFADFGNWSLSMYHQSPAKEIETTGPEL
jgi:hypothetical protein